MGHKCVNPGAYCCVNLELFLTLIKYKVKAAMSQWFINSEIPIYAATHSDIGPGE